MWSAISIAVSFVVAGALYGAWAVPAIRAGASPWGFVIGIALVYLAFVALLVAWYFILAWMFRAHRPPQARIGPAATLRLVWYEYWTLAGAAFRMLLYKTLVPDPPPAPAQLPVLLVHGVLCNAGVWARTVRYLRAAGVGPVYGLSYGPPLASIEVFAEQLDARIGDIRAATGAPQVFIVAHSMGGLVTLAYLRRYGRARVRRVVTIGSPFHGSVHAFLMFGTSLGQLRPGNAWLHDLDAMAPKDGPPFVSVWSWHDSMVAPQTSAELHGARNVALPGIGHNALLRDPAVMKRIVDEYREAVREEHSSATSVSPA
jgi:pimeloyl-ACP methyl ester carboxylesterase